MTLNVNTNVKLWCSFAIYTTTTGSCDTFEVGFTIMDKSLGSLAFLGRFPIHTGPTPPLTPKTMLDVCIQNFFLFSTLHKLGEGRTAIKFRKGCTLLWGIPEMTEKCEYCITVSRTFVHDCGLAVREWKQLELSRWNLLSNTLFSVMLLTTLYKVVLTVGSVGEILKRDH